MAGTLLHRACKEIEIRGKSDMPLSVSSHDFIKEKVKALKDTYPSLRSKRDEYVFSALCVKANFYKILPSSLMNEILRTSLLMVNMTAVLMYY